MKQVRRTTRGTSRRGARRPERARGAGFARLAFGFAFEARGVRVHGVKVDVLRARVRLTVAVVIVAAAIAAALAVLRELRRGGADETGHASPIGRPHRLGGRHVVE